MSAKLNFLNPNHRNATNANSTTSAMSMAASSFVPTISFVVCPAIAPTSVPTALMKRTSANVGNKANRFCRPTANTTSHTSMSKLRTPMRKSAFAEGRSVKNVNGAMMKPATTNSIANENNMSSLLSLRDSSIHAATPTSTTAETSTLIGAWDTSLSVSP